MSGANRIRANQVNALRSTGPKTAAGKARVSKNAIRHGLAIDVNSLSELNSEIEELARLLAGECPSSIYLALARAVAEAQIDLKRIREAKMRAYGDPATFKAHICESDLIHYLRSAYEDTVDDDDPQIRNMIRELGDLNEAWLKLSFEEKFTRGIGKLNLIDRYERRALSRRKRAIRRLFEAEAEPKEELEAK